MRDEPDWAAIRRDYEETEMSLRDIAAKHKAPRGKLPNRIHLEKWRRAKQLRFRPQSRADNFDALLKTLRLGVDKILRRDARLMKRLEGGEGSLKEAFELHHSSINALAALMKMSDGLRKMSNEEKAREPKVDGRAAKEEFQNRLIRYFDEERASEDPGEAE